MIWKRLSQKIKPVGGRGEQVAAQYFKQRGWKILATNYDRGVGEIDLIGQSSDGIVHLVEVKTVTDINPGRQLEPAERVGPQKRSRLKKVISIYIEEQGLRRSQTDWQFDIAEVTLDPLRVEVLENVIL